MAEAQLRRQRAIEILLADLARDQEFGLEIGSVLAGKSSERRCPIERDIQAAQQRLPFGQFGEQIAGEK